MVPLLLKFVSIARAAGLRISTSEVLDSLNQLELVDPLDEPQFVAVLQANFAKSKREQYHFNRLYNLFFHELRQEWNIANADPLENQIQHTLDDLASEINADAAAQAVLDFLGGDPQSYFERMQTEVFDGDHHRGGLGSGLGAMVRRLELLLQINSVEAALTQLLTHQRDRMHWEIRRDLKALFDARLASARRLLTRVPHPITEDNTATPASQWHQDQLGEVHFASLTPKEVEGMRAVIEQLMRKLKDNAGRRYAKRNRGALDIKRTLRRAAAYQGMPLELFFRKRPPRKTKIVALCDVSGSVWSAARFMLNMLYSLQECFTQVRSFIFVAGLEEVTRIFEDCEINQAIEKVLKETSVEYNAATDYGLTLQQFKKHYLDILNKKTTVIVIGDGRTNYGNPQATILAEMRERARRLIWLNPETPTFWYTGDSEMRTYQNCCDEVRPCQNLNQLLEFVESLVL